tara:strand:- start:1772 stop:4138 length:2367 start_codon:yes stop_codon:yes gene_type:complete
MNQRRISIFLTVLLLLPLLSTVQADGSEQAELEAKNLTATFNSTSETVTVSWENIDTNDYLILEDLKKTNYSLYRSDEPLNSSNYLSAQLVEDSIQACLEPDTFTECKNRQHVVVLQTPANTDGGFYYGVVSTLLNGTIIADFSIGNASLAQPIYEFGSPITSPYSLQAVYDASLSTTELSWIDVSQVDASVDSNHTTSIWSHAVKATRSNWDSINKTSIADNLSSNTNSFDIVHPTNTSRVQFYTVMHSFNGLQDERFLSSNSLTQGLTEDNVGSSITGTLILNFDTVNMTTHLNWNGSVIEDENHTLHIWRSPAMISNLNADEVVEIAQLEANSTQFNYTVESGYSGDSYYLITLSDELGNQQENLLTAPNGLVHEFTLGANQNIVTDLDASHSMGITQLTWTDLDNHSEAKYQIWRSITGQISSVSDGVLLATVDAGIEHYNYTLDSGVSENSWYAVTVIASFGTQNVTYAQTNISLGLNSLNALIVEDTKKPTPPSTLQANYRVDGTTELTWMGDGMETGTTWMIYRNLYSDMDEPSFWELVAQIENTVASQYTISVDSVAQVGEEVSAVYAIGGIDVFGNEVDFADWTLSDSVDEDRKTPDVQLKLYNAASSLETSRWFVGGENATFSNLQSGDYTIQFTLSEDAVSMVYTISTNAQSQTVDLTQGPATIALSLSNQTPDVTITITVTDSTGNFASFYTVFCTSCLIEAAPPIQVDDSNQQDEVSNDETDGDSSMEVNVLIGVCVVLLIALLSTRLRGPKSFKTPSGLPTKAEDEWLSKYTQK